MNRQRILPSIRYILNEFERRILSYHLVVNTLVQTALFCTAVASSRVFIIKIILKNILLYMIRQRISSATILLWIIFSDCASLKRQKRFFVTTLRGTNHGYHHVCLGKVFRFSISLSETKGLVKLYSNPKYEAVWFCY